MPRPKGLPKTGGRQKGVSNKVTADIREAAQEHGPKALKKLVSLMINGDTDAVKLGAAKEILDRAYGKSTITADINVTREVVDITDAELAALARAGSARAAQAQNGEEEASRLH